MRRLQEKYRGNIMTDPIKSLSAALVWIDHREAKIFRVSATEVGQAVVSAHGTGHHLQHKANVHGSGHQGVDTEFFKRVMGALTHTGAILITGPANAKSELKNYIAEHRPDIGERIAAVQALDHPSDAELIALARKFFRPDDKPHSQPH
jgi:stalled ribosome rescue protein Dom34